MKTKQIGIGFCVIGVALCVVPWIVHNVQTPAEYYGASSGEDTGLHASISIDCSRVYGAWDQLDPALQAGGYFPENGQILPEVELMTPKGIGLHLEVLDPKLSKGEASCAIRKDAGDDIRA